MPKLIPAEPALATKHGLALTLPVVKFKRIKRADGNSPTRRGAFAQHRQQRREKRDRRR